LPASTRHLAIVARCSSNNRREWPNLTVRETRDVPAWPL
jgi:hypothetical protein